jgi:hypothetical protein
MNHRIFAPEKKNAEEKEDIPMLRDASLLVPS